MLSNIFSVMMLLSNYDSLFVSHKTLNRSFEGTKRFKIAIYFCFGLFPFITTMFLSGLKFQFLRETFSVWMIPVSKKAQLHFCFRLPKVHYLPQGFSNHVFFTSFGKIPGRSSCLNFSTMLKTAIYVYIWSVITTKISFEQSHIEKFKFKKIILVIVAWCQTTTIAQE